VAYRPQHYATWAVEERKSRRVVGMVNYHRRFLISRRVDVGWLIRADRQSKGLAAEGMRAVLHHVIEDLEVHKVESADRAGQQGLAGPRAQARVSQGGRPDPRPLEGERGLA
jgi:hypothetical protein